MKKHLLFVLLVIALLLAACAPAEEPEPTDNLIYVTATPVMSGSADQVTEEPMQEATEESNPTDQPEATDEPADEPTAEPPAEPAEATTIDTQAGPYAPTATPVLTEDDFGPDELNTLNKIANPNFTEGEDRFVAPDGRVVTAAPHDWGVWAEGALPEYYQEGNPQHILDDFAAWSWTLANEPMNAGLYQQFHDLMPGGFYRATCWMFAYAGDGVPGTPSTGTIRLQIGIDPLGGEDPDAPSVIWGFEYANMLGNITNLFQDAYVAEDVYAPYTISFTAVDARATIFLRARGNDAYPRSSVTVDSCSMYALGWADQFGEPMP